MERGCGDFPLGGQKFMRGTSEVVLQGLVSNAFWLILLVVIVVAFRVEIRNLLNSLGSFKVAGASFELKDSRSTIESYVLLTNIMMDVLCQRDTAVRMGDMLLDLHVRQLAQFAVKYAKEAPEDAKQITLLTNVAYIVGRRGETDSATQFFDSILRDRPNDLDILNLKAITLSDTNSPKYVEDAEAIQDELVRTRPREARYRFNRAITKARLGKFEDAIDDLDVAIDLKFFTRRKEMLEAPEFAQLRQLPRFEELKAKLRAARNASGG
jgi:tetratricopeptide (TPR) repeat protein